MARLLTQLRACLGVAALLGLNVHLAPMGYAQSTINSVAIEGPGLPLKNLLIEVRQSLVSQGASTDVRGAAGLDWGSNGVVGLQGRANVQSQQQEQSARVLQQATVLNGRSTQINLGRAMPLRLRQTVKLQGVWRTVESVVFLDATTGFTAQPRWDGGDSVELVLSAQQNALQDGGDSSTRTTSSASSTVLLPLGEWFTIAKSEQQSSTEASGLTGLTKHTAAVDAAIQVRISPR